MILAIVIVTSKIIVKIVIQGGEWVLEAENDQRPYSLLLDIWKVIIIIINVESPTIDIIKSIISAVKIGRACKLGFICVKLGNMVALGPIMISMNHNILHLNNS